LSAGGVAYGGLRGGPATIDVSTKTIDVDTTVDGGELITFTGGNGATVLSVNSGVNFTVENLTVANGRGSVEAAGGIVNGTFTGGGSLIVTNCIFDSNNGFVGAIYSYGGSVTITSSIFTDNHGADVGAIFNGSGSLTITNSAFTNNGSDRGGGIANGGTLIVTTSTFTGNSSGAGGFGGGIYNLGTLTVANSTFTANHVVGPAGVEQYGLGGGILNGGTLTVTNSTFTGNVGENFSGGIYTGDGPTVLRNTIVASNFGNCTGTITDGGHNLDDGTSCGFSTANGSQSNTDPQFDPAGLQDNGGPTETVALCTGAGVPAGCTAASPAWGAGDQSICAVAPVNSVDQRGLARAQGCPPFRCSIGAYEPFATTPICAGDCDRNGHVTVDELIKGVNIVLGTTAVDDCLEFLCDWKRRRSGGLPRPGRGRGARRCVRRVTPVRL
jgi:hypothetical protein